MKHISPAMEDYLETISLLSAEGGVARVRDIARTHKVSPPTVTGALKQLAQLGLVHYKPYEVIRLTSEGRKVAQRVARRHKLMARFLREVLGVAPDIAQTDACRLEHGLSTQTVAQLIEFMQYFDASPDSGAQWLHRFTSTRTTSSEGRTR